VSMVPEPQLTVSTTSMYVGEQITLTCNLGTDGVYRPVAFFEVPPGGEPVGHPATTDGSGVATITLTATSDWVPEVSFQVRDEVTGATSDWVDVTVSEVPMASISGVVRDDVTGEPISGATVKLQQSGLVKHEVTSSADGGYSISEVEPGTYDMVANRTGYQPWTQTKTFNPGDHLLGQDIDMAPGYLSSFSGIIQDGTTSSPIYGATVQLVQSGQVKYEVTSGVSGYYSIPSVNPDTYVVCRVSRYLRQASHVS